MNIFLWVIIPLAFSLAMDAVAVSIVSGLSKLRVQRREAFKMALCFSLFHVFMPLIGYAGGLAFKAFIGSIDHWIAFGLLAFIGGKMVKEGLSVPDADAEKLPYDPFEWKNLLLLGVATSIDVLAVGVTFSLLDFPILLAVLIIGSVVFILCYFAIIFSTRLGLGFSHKASVAGGIILILIGVKILLEHLLTGV